MKENVERAGGYSLFSLKKIPNERKFRYEFKLGHVLKINEKSEKTTLKRLKFFKGVSFSTKIIKF